MTTTSKNNLLFYSLQSVRDHSYLISSLPSSHFVLLPFSSTRNFPYLVQISWEMLPKLPVMAGQVENDISELWTADHIYFPYLLLSPYPKTFPLSEPNYDTCTHVERIHTNKRKHTDYFCHHHFYPGFEMRKRKTQVWNLGRRKALQSVAEIIEELKLEYFSDNIWYQQDKPTKSGL